jgi:hypothetical protein
MSSLRDLADALTVEAVLTYCGIEPPRPGRKIPCPIHKGEGQNFGIIPNDPCRWNCFSHACGSGARRDAVNLLGYLRYSGSLKTLPRASKADLLRSCEELSGVTLDENEKVDQSPVSRLHGMTQRDAVLVADYLIGQKDLAKADSDDFETYPGQMALLWLQSCVALGKKLDQEELERFIKDRRWANGVS